MKPIILLAGLILAIGTLTLVGCGGGGGGGTVAGSSATPASYSVSGVASKGPISGATIKVYSLINGVKGSSPLGTGTTGADGSYSVSIGSYTGPVLVELIGGTGTTYVDEATGLTATVPNGTTFLRAALSNATGSVTVALTPLTELAVRRAATASAPFSSAAITTANQVVSDLFGLSDIVSIRPVAPTAAAMGGASVTDAQRSYTLALAAFSQLAGGATTVAVDSAITALNGGIDSTTNVMNAPTATSFSTALSAFIGGGNNNTGQTGASPLVTSLASEVGVRTATIDLTATGITASNVYGISATITLPADRYRVAYNLSTGLLDSAKVSTSTGAYYEARYDSGAKTVTVTLLKGDAAIPDGALISIQFEIDSGFDTSAVTVSAPAFKDSNGSPVVIGGTPLTVAVR